MKRRTNRTIILISIVIILGIFIVSIWNYKNYSEIIREDIRNISKLTSTNMYSQIDKELTKPIFVSLTMANDDFLKNWIHDEGKSMLTLTQQQFQLLSALQFYDEASIYGCAGSGKTLMAVEKAIMESKKGKKV